jgi:hypothetical protein
MTAFSPLLADAGDVIEIAALILIVVIPAVAQMIAKVKQAQQPPAKGPPRPGQPPKRPAPADVANEIEDFLKKAAQKRDLKRPSPIPARPAPRKVDKIEKPVKAEVVADRPVGGVVEQHVQKYLDAEEFQRRESQLGEEVAQSDREIDQHLHQVFDHDVSQLATLPGEAAAAPVAVGPMELTGPSQEEIPPLFASGLFESLSNPDALRQAIVLNEILHRPEERWA